MVDGHEMVTDDATLYRAQELAELVRIGRRYRWFVGSDCWAQYKRDLDDLLDLLDPPG